MISMGKLQTTKMNDHIYKVNETDENGLNVDSYLVLGSKKAVVIDALQDNTDLYDEVKQLTDLPLSLLLTHGHPDHAGKSCKKFVENDIPVYMHVNDTSVLDLFEKDDWKEKLLPLNDLDTFELGDRTLTTYTCFGHTPGSVVFFDEENEEIFTGDAIGSGGFWMQLDHSLSLQEYLPHVEHLYDLVKDCKNLKIYLGHSGQSSTIPSLKYIEDNIEATKLIIEGKLSSDVKTMHVGAQEIPYCSVSHGEIWDYCYNPNNIKKQ